ncbi:DUF6916 family protein [Undibacterium danionis]|uniref:DUF6916 family protein n=1 Tax=Undibacterium danionis TaxID=1812100 RepID=A0ABV6IIS1_9BURK
MEFPQYDSFLQSLHSSFEVHSDIGITIDLVLRTVTASGNNSSDTSSQAHQSFSLIFEGNIEKQIPQGMHRFRHTQLGEFDLFIVPIGPERGSNQMRYEAIFN